MKEAVIIYPHQLFKNHPALAGDIPVYLVEEPLLLTHNPIHRQRLLLHKLSMDAYQAYLEDNRYPVIRLSVQEHETSDQIFDRIKADGITTVHVVDTTDSFLETALADSGLERVWYESPLFLLEKSDAIQRYHASKKHLAAFYKKLRQERGILIETDGSPTGGKWSFDAENRKKVPKGVTPPEDIAWLEDKTIAEAITWCSTVPAEQYGTANVWVPYTHEEAETFLHTFLNERFEQFGDYEDAILTTHTRLWHSTLSPLLNIGLLTPEEVIEAALIYAKKHHTPINSLEGFIRQIVGWREFIRASYETDGSVMRNKNFWQHTRSLPESFWTGTTYITPVNHSIHTALQTGYTHHIERLMVLGNFMLLNQIHPTEVYRWFMGMYVDAYDWVMVPNVYGMSQFADGGSFATKPYISGANYIKKMSNFSSGNWEETWTALYWYFNENHFEFFTKNHRLAMMPRLLQKMDSEKRTHYQKVAEAWLQKNDRP